MNTLSTATAPIDSVVVAGASVGGLLAAAAAARHARRVVVIERDRLPDEPRSRARTPHARHSHGLLAAGRASMEELLPGLTDELVAAGAFSARDAGSVGRWWIGGALLADCHLGHQGAAVSRALLEHTIRRRVRALPHVEILEDTEVVGLLGDRTRITGVTVRHHDADPSRPRAAETLSADLVIDATGRSARGRRWLVALGATEPAEERVTVGLRYVTIHMPAYPADLDGRAVAVSAAVPPVPRGGVAIRQEDHTWTVTLFGYGDRPLPVDPDGLRRYAGTIVGPEIAALLDGRPPLHEPWTYRFPDCRRQRFERLDGLPLGYAPIGDSICSVDPALGQGMSVAALEALALAGAISSGVEAVRAVYPREAAAIADRAWTVAMGALLPLAEVDGAPSLGQRLIGRYVRRVQRVARHDPVVSAAFMRVTNLLAGPESLMSPAVARRVFFPARRPGDRVAKRSTAEPFARDAGHNQGKLVYRPGRVTRDYPAHNTD